MRMVLDAVYNTFTTEPGHIALKQTMFLYLKICYLHLRNSLTYFGKIFGANQYYVFL
jgi:hypothetical protein